MLIQLHRKRDALACRAGQEMLQEPCQKWKNSHDDKQETKELPPQTWSVAQSSICLGWNKNIKLHKVKTNPQINKNTKTSTTTNYSVRVRNSQTKRCLTSFIIFISNNYRIVCKPTSCLIYPWTPLLIAPVAEFHYLFVPGRLTGLSWVNQQ